MAVTIEDVASQAKLNKGSVSRILNGKGEGYSQATRQRVLETASALGYQPNALSRALWTGQTQTIALWTLFEDYYQPYYGFWHHCVQRLVDGSGYRLITESIPLVETRQSSAPPKVHWPVDGVLMCHPTSAAAAYLYSVLKNQSPVVMMQPVWAEQKNSEAYPNTDFVRVDLEMGTRQAVEHLLHSGCKRIGFVAQPYMMTHDPRGPVYHEVMHEAGLLTELIAIKEDTRSSATALKAHIERYGCPDGLFCANDEVAIGCAMALHELGFRVPDDVLLVGFDGLDNARFLPCPISSVSIPLQELSELSWQLLQQRMKNPDAPTQQHTLPTRLEIRASSQR